MKTLYIMRHAQKDESKPEQYDYDVELTQKGLEDCEKIAQKLKDRRITPDLIVASPAIRTRQTAEIVAKTLDYLKNIMYNEVIYQAFVNEIIESITYTFDTVDSLMIIGHNPALTALAITFTEFREEIKMGSIVKIEFDCDSWTAIDKTNAKFIEHFKLD
ncbi:histidine phosphatase family protein [Arcobacter sp. LA11]|uniref:SixA phosphatase family protein n=1 Tax=Arcobacter sp. LA11 TaxID=1898176 RepID=UPI000932D446|nr:histidine phosphatase family protein [Arcobacter sp. LA11]